MLYSTILEQGVDSANDTNLYLLLTPWLLMYVVLTNPYKSLITSDLIAPRELELLKDFDQLVTRDFTIYVRPLSHKDKKDEALKSDGIEIPQDWDDSDIYDTYLLK